VFIGHPEKQEEALVVVENFRLGCGRVRGGGLWEDMGYMYDNQKCRRVGRNEKKKENREGKKWKKETYYLLYMYNLLLIFNIFSRLSLILGHTLLTPFSPPLLLPSLSPHSSLSPLASLSPLLSLHLSLSPSLSYRY
jgi:hypothetical protein